MSIATKQVIRVGSLLFAADPAGLANRAVLDRQIDAAHVILDEQQVTIARAVAIDRHRLANQRNNDDQGTTFSGELIRPEVLGAVVPRNLKSVAVIMRTDEVIQGCLAGSIRRVRRIRHCLSNNGIRRAQSLSMRRKLTWQCSGCKRRAAQVDDVSSTLITGSPGGSRINCLGNRMDRYWRLR